MIDLSEFETQWTDQLTPTHGLTLGVACVSEAGACCVSMRPCWRKPDEAMATSASAACVSPWHSEHQSGPGQWRPLCQRIPLSPSARPLNGTQLLIAFSHSSSRAPFTSIWLLPLPLWLSTSSWVNVRFQFQVDCSCSGYWNWVVRPHISLHLCCYSGSCTQQNTRRCV